MERSDLWLNSKAPELPTWGKTDTPERGFPLRRSAEARIPPLRRGKLPVGSDLHVTL